MDIMERIKQAIESNTVILFMKGTPEFPQCGFSSRSSQALSECGAEFAFINVLAEQIYIVMLIGQPFLSYTSAVN